MRRRKRELFVLLVNTKKLLSALVRVLGRESYETSSELMS
jgi:hypothetical protein